MAMLLFYAGDNRFAIDCVSILRVVPNVLLKKLPNGVSYVAGLMISAGEPVPVIDFCEIIENRSSHPFLNSRIIILKDTYCGTGRLMGLLAEKVEEIVDLKSDQFNQSEFYLQHFHFLEKGYTDEKGVIHEINLHKFFHFLFSDIFHG